MTGTFALNLQSATQFLRVETVVSFVARDGSGAFGLLAGHERFMTVLEFGLARFRGTDGVAHYLALPRAVAYFEGGELSISTRRYVLGDDYRAVADALAQALAAEESALRGLKDSVTRLEREMLRRLWRLAGTPG